MKPTTAYTEFLTNKVIIAESFGFEVPEAAINPLLKPHNKSVALWALAGGRRAIFLNFGLHKSFTQLEIATQCINKYQRPFLIACPLAVAGEFKRDAAKFGIPYKVTYITDSDTIQDYEPQIYLTNYERIRMGDIDASKFCGVSFDEASILRNLKTETTNYVLNYFGKVPMRFVATATPTPNDLIEILNYAVFLGVASRGHLLTRFFQRDSTHAGHLTLYPNKKKEFWQWVSTWAVFVNMPSDLGFSDEGYVLPELRIHEHQIKVEAKESYIDRTGKQVFFKDISKSLQDVSKEKRESITERCAMAVALAKQVNSALIWHHLEDERAEIERLLKGAGCQSVYGSQPNQVKEKLLIEFSEGKYPYLATKPKIAGSGCNFQAHCHTAIFAGIDYKFNDFLQAIHRILRFGQTQPVDIHLLYTQQEYEVLKTLYAKWALHKELQREMIALVKEYGLNTQIIKQQMARQIFKNGNKVTIGNATLYNNDTVVITADKTEMPDNSVDMILTSIPFGDHYEYSDNYNDFGHNHGNDAFFEQMEYLTPELLRVLKPGHIGAIHVKDRIRYSYQNGTSFTTIEDFSGQTVAHFTKADVKQRIRNLKGDIKTRRAQVTNITKENHISLERFTQINAEIEALEGTLQRLEADYANRWYLMGKITVTTDVVSENNQTYRLTWGEQCKDATKMGAGLPEYILLFRKAPTSANNAYADEPVTKTKEEYTLPIWQLDAHAYWRSNGNRFLTPEEMQRMDVKTIYRAWQKHNTDNVYTYAQHLKACNDLDAADKLSRLFMSLPVHSNSEFVWTDINRMNTLNAKQVNSKKEKHICPLQIDIIRRLIHRFTNPGQTVYDPFGGLFSTAYVALEMGRKAVSVELNPEYFIDGVCHVKAMDYKLNVPTLFDLLGAIEPANELLVNEEKAA